MEMIEFLDYAELGEYIHNLTSQYNTISAVLFKKDIIGLLKWLMEYDDIELGHIDIKNEYIDDYSKEYYLTLDDDYSITIEPVYEENTDAIIPCYSDVVLFDGGVSSKIAIENEDCIQIEIAIADYNNEGEDTCGDCCYDCGSCPKAMASQAFYRLFI